MSWFSRNKRAGSGPGPAAADDQAIFLDALGRHVLGTLPDLEKADPNLDLVRARLADIYRDWNVEPMDPELFTKRAREFDIESQKRFALTVAGLEDEGTQKQFQRCSGDGAQSRIELLWTFARTHALLTVQVLLESPLRREEFARHFIAALGGRIRGESPGQSADRLARLDYKNLLAEAERAKVSATERLAYLKKLQDEQEQRLGRRGKI